MTKIAIINGPNLNRLGRRDPQIYGDASFEDCLDSLQFDFPDCTFEYFQSNSEGAIIDRIQQIDDDPECVALIINPGAYAHYSFAIADALRDCSSPQFIIEVHISNILAREEFRHTSVTAPAARSGVITGLGLDGYRLAVIHIIHALRKS